MGESGLSVVEEEDWTREADQWSVCGEWLKSPVQTIIG
jgi:hypothetical protein